MLLNTVCQEATKCLAATKAPFSIFHIHFNSKNHSLTDKHKQWNCTRDKYAKIR